MSIYSCFCRAFLAVMIALPLAFFDLGEQPSAALGAGQDFWIGRAAYQIGHYSRALEHWLRLLNKEPQDLTLRYWIGKAHHQLGHREEAVRYWQPLLRVDSNDVSREVLAIQAETGILAGLIRKLDAAGTNTDALNRLLPELGRFIGRTADARSRQRARFLLAVAHERMGDSVPALGILGLLTDEYGVLKVPLLARMARLQRGQGHFAEAVALYTRLLKLEEHPRWYLALAEAQEKSGRTDLAVATMQMLLSRFPQSMEADRALWTMADRQWKEHSPHLSSTLRLYLTRFPAGRYAGPTLTLFRSLPAGQLTLADHFLMGQRALQMGQYAPAISALTLCANRGYRPADSWNLMGEAYRDSGDTTRAIQVWQQALVKYPSGKTYLNLGEAYLDRRQFGPGLEAFQQVVRRYPPLAAEALWNIARILDRQARDREKFQTYQQLYQRFPQSDRATSALWRSFWADYTARRWESAVTKADHFLRSYPESSLRPAFQFWLARLEMAYGHPERAQELVNRVVAESPLSYYSLRLQNGAPVTSADGQPGGTPKPPPDWQLPEVTDEVDGLLGRSRVWPVMAGLPHHLQELLLLHQYEGVVAELGGAKSVAGRWLKSVLFFKMGRYKDSIRHAAGSSDPALLPLAYPIPFRESILQQTAAYNLNPLLVAALIREESRYDPSARSYVGAQGLMQLMPGTGRTLALQVGLKDVAPLNYYDPQLNIALGCRYLSNAIRLFGGRSFLAVAGYNAGTGAVRGWLGRFPVEDPDEFIENIPFTETREYVKKVFASFWMYQRVYG